MSKQQSSSTLSHSRSEIARSLVIFKNIISFFLIACVQLQINVVAFFSDRGNAVTFTDISDGMSTSLCTSDHDNGIDNGSALLSSALPGHEWVTPRSSEELLARFSDFSPSVRSLLSCIPTPSAWAVHTCAPPLLTYVRGRVALLGDAAHAMPPHLGSGAGQAIEDAYAMGQLLAHPSVTRDNIEVCVSYQHILQYITETVSCIASLCI